jgi:PAS domain S-box-containing protein
MSVARQVSAEPQTEPLSFPRMFTLDGSRFRYVATVLLIAAVYFAAGKFGLTLASVHTNVSPVWPPAGIAIAALLLVGIRAWPGIFVGALLVNLSTPIPVTAAIAIAIGNTLEAVCAAGVLRAFSFRNSLDRARDVFKFVCVAVVCTTVSATIGNLSLTLWHSAEWSQFSLLWLTWWFGDLTGAVTVAPLILTWLGGKGHWLPRRRYLEASVLILLLSLSAMVTFGGQSPASIKYYPLSRLMIPFLLWAAFRLGRRGVTVAIAVVSAFAIWGTSHGNGPFISSTANESLLMLQLFLASNAVTFLALVTVVEERRIAEENRREGQRRIEANLAVTRILAESPEVNLALGRILATVGESLAWEFGCVWLPDADGQRLRSVGTWQSTQKASKFEQICRERTFERGVGLPGRVWTNLKPAWIRDVAVDDNFPRAAVATEEGLHSAFAFPILFNQEFLGVIEFFSPEIRQPERPVLAMFGGIGSQIGQFMERKRVEAEVESASLLPKENPAPVVRVTRDGIVAFANPAADQLLHAWDVAVGKKAPAEIVAKAGEVFANAKREAIQTAIADRIYSIQFVPIVSANYVNLYFADITDEKSIEDALRESEARYRSVIDALPAAVYTTDANGKVTMFNQAAVELSGRVPEVGNDSWCVTWKLYHPDGTPMPHAECPMAMALKTGKSVRGYEAIAERPDGSRVSFVPYPTPLRDNSGKLVGAINMLVDITDRKRAEAQLRDREQRLSAFFSTAALGVAVLTPEARFEQVNDTFCRIAGYSRAELLKMDWQTLTHPDDAPLLNQKMDALLSGRIPRFEIEKRYIRKDRAQIWVQNSVSITRDGGGRPLNLVSLCQDITARKHTETALKQSEHELADFFENASEAIHWIGPDGVVLRANKAELEMLGYSADEYVGRNIADFHVDKENIRDILARLHAGETLNTCPSQMIAKDGSIRDVLINASVYFENGKFVHTRCFTRDVTENARTEKALRHLAAIVETTDDAVISKDLNGIITSWNPAAQRLYGYTAEEAIGQPVTIMIPADRPDEEPAILARLRRGERIDHYETIRVAKDGRRLHVSLTVSPIQDATGKIVGASKIARDITQQKKAQNEIARLLAAERAARREAEVASRTKDEFLATLSHELRTPLTAMLGWLTILRSHRLDDTTTKHAIETIERNAKAQAQLIEDLVDISRIVGGKLSLEVGPIELYPVLDAAVEVVKPAADAKHISVEINYDATVGPVSGDANRVQQIIWNLLSNAVKFTPNGGKVVVDYKRHGSFAEIVVRDTGIGISEDFLPYVFERFRQAESAATRSHRGMGLGLAIVRHLVELHGGTVSVESAGENKGSTFTVHLPLAAVPKASPTATLSPQNGDLAQALNGLKILLVEDEPDARELIAILLQGSGATVEAVDTASNALQRLPIFIPDVVVSDIGLPRESGYELIRKIRSSSADVNKIPAIALTAFATENDRQMSLSAGFQAHLAKPVEPAELLNTIKIVINGEN